MCFKTFVKLMFLYFFIFSNTYATPEIKEFKGIDSITTKEKAQQFCIDQGFDGLFDFKMESHSSSTTKSTSETYTIICVKENDKNNNSTNEKSVDSCNKIPNKILRFEDIYSTADYTASTCQNVRFKKLEGLNSIVRSIQNKIPLNNQLKIKILTSLAKPSENPLLWYRWGAKYEYTRIGKKPAFDLSNSNNSGKRSAGLGLYVSETLLDSAEYVSPQDGAVVAIKGEKGVPVLDLTDPNVQKKMNSWGLINDDVFTLNPPVMVKYTEPRNGELKTFWVLKTSQGVSIIPLNQVEFLENSDNADSIFLKLPKKAKEIFKDQLPLPTKQ